MISQLKEWDRENPLKQWLAQLWWKRAIEEEHVKENTWMILEMEDQWPNDLGTT